MQGSDGKKFKTRSGEVVRLVELLDEAERRAPRPRFFRTQDKKRAFFQHKTLRVVALFFVSCGFFPQRKRRPPRTSRSGRPSDDRRRPTPSNDTGRDVRFYVRFLSLSLGCLGREVRWRVFWGAYVDPRSSAVELWTKF